jgi:uncharacterized protein YfaS (alpha-2-macroglobulin family)
VLVKDEAGGIHDVFVQSIRSGQPLADVDVATLGRNGLPVVSDKSDANGRVTFPDLRDFKHEKAPTVYVVQKEQDFSSLPYDRPDRQLIARHSVTDRSKGKYARPDGIHSNTVESAFSLLKRGIYRTFHNVSRKHLHRYVAEFDFRWNARNVDDGGRTALAIRNSEGKRLRYREPIAMIEK